MVTIFKTSQQTKVFQLTLLTTIVTWLVPFIPLEHNVQLHNLLKHSFFQIFMTINSKKLLFWIFVWKRPPKFLFLPFGWSLLRFLPLSLFAFLWIWVFLYWTYITSLSNISNMCHGWHPTKLAKMINHTLEVLESILEYNKHFIW